MCERPPTPHPLHPGLRTDGGWGETMGAGGTRGEVLEAVGIEPEGTFLCHSLYERLQCYFSHCVTDQSLHMSRHIVEATSPPTPNTRGVQVPK